MSACRTALGRGDGAHLSDGPDGAAQLLSGSEGGYIIGAISYSRWVRLPSQCRCPVALPSAALFCAHAYYLREEYSFFHRAKPRSPERWLLAAFMV
jgi:hypothetical protein